MPATDTVLSLVRSGLLGVLAGLTTADGRSFDATFPTQPDLDQQNERVFGWTELGGYGGGNRIANDLTMHRWAIYVVAAMYACQADKKPDYDAVASFDDQFGVTLARALATYVTANVPLSGAGGSVQRTELVKTEWAWFETKGQKLFRLLSFELTVLSLDSAAFVIPS